MTTWMTGLATGGDSRAPAGRRRGAGGVLLGLAAAAALLSGCESTPTAASPEVQPSELEDAANRPCPEELPAGNDPSQHGFGTEEPADELPALLEPQKAWVCRYFTVDGGMTANGGAIYKWRSTGPTEPVAAGDLPDLKAALDDLAPADHDRSCTDELGPRWMVVYSHDGDLTGVVVDAYGCRDVRLTNNPHATPPGADHQHGTVGGVFDGGTAVLDAVGIDPWA